MNPAPSRVSFQSKVGTRRAVDRCGSACPTSTIDTYEPKGNRSSIGSDHTLRTTTRVADGQWHHVAAVRDVSSGVLILYVRQLPEVRQLPGARPTVFQLSPLIHNCPFTLWQVHRWGCTHVYVTRCMRRFHDARNDPTAHRFKVWHECTAPQNGYRIAGVPQRSLPLPCQVNSGGRPFPA